MADVAACKVMGFQWIAPHIQTGFYRGDAIVHNQTDGYFAQPHPNHFAKTYRRIRDPCAQPETEEIEKNNREHKCEYRQYRNADEIKRFHVARSLSEQKSLEKF